MSVTISVEHERWAIEGGFTISRGARTHADVVCVTLEDGHHRGQGECVPYPRYGESVEGVMQALQAMQPALSAELSRQALQDLMPPGAARNALDCALWDLEAKRQSKPAYMSAGLPAMRPVVTAFTISVGSAEKMAADAAKAAHRPLLKIKLGGEGDPERIALVRKAAPDSELIVDANEAWTAENFARNLAACEAANVRLIEQPLPSGQDALLRDIESKSLICADESLHTSAELEALADRYNAVNIKLDKAGGLTEALKMMQKARELKLTVMIGCMLGTSLAMAPATLIAQNADFVDLDGPLLLTTDRKPGLKFKDSTLYPPEPELWG